MFQNENSYQAQHDAFSSEYVLEIDEFEDNFVDVLRDALTRHTIVKITKYGEELAVLMSPGWYEALDKIKNDLKNLQNDKSENIQE